MEKTSIMKGLHPLEIKILHKFKKEENLTNKLLMAELGFNLGQCNQAFSWLSSKGLLKEEQRRRVVQYELTELSPCQIRQFGSLLTET